MNFCILPAGAWGTAMAIHLARNKHTVTLVPRTLEEALDITGKRENLTFFPGYFLESNIQIGYKLKPVLMEAEVVILACPTKFLRNVCREIRSEMSSAWRLKIFITLCKGLEPVSNKLPGQVLEEEIPDYPYGVLSGPTFASQVARGKPSAIVLAAKASADLLADVQYAISDENFRVYTSEDLIGTTLGGCLKNVYAIASGICDGLELGDNTKAALLTRSLAEMVRRHPGHHRLR